MSFNRPYAMLHCLAVACLPTSVLGQSGSTPKSVSCDFWTKALASAQANFDSFPVEPRPSYECSITAGREKRGIDCNLPHANNPALAAQQLSAEIAVCLPDAKFYRPVIDDENWYGPPGSQTIVVRREVKVFISFGDTPMYKANLAVSFERFP